MSASAIRMSHSAVDVLVARVAEKQGRIEDLTRDLKSAQSRNAILVGALQRARFASGDMEHASTIRGEAKAEPLLKVAQTIEAAGGVPAIRFARNAEGIITGIELAVVARGVLPAPSGEMAVVGQVDDDDATGCPA